MRLHALILARNEASNLPDCISSLRSAVDDITVFDTGSMDDTAAVVRELDVPCVALPWRDDFAAARNAALKHLPTGWVLVIDADERLAARSAEVIRTALQQADESTKALHLEVRTYTDDVEQLGYTGLGSSESERRGAAGFVMTPQPRLLWNGCGLRYCGRVEETLCDAHGEALLRPSVSHGIIHHGREQETIQRRAQRQAWRVRLALRDYLETQTPLAAAKLGAILNEQHQWKPALAYLRLAEASPENGIAVHMQAGLARLQLGLIDGATASFRRAWEELPGHPEIATWLARSLLQQGSELALCSDLLDLALEEAPDLDLAVVMKAHLQRTRGQFEEASAWLQAILERNPVHPLALKELGAIELLRGTPREAERHLRLALRMRPQDPQLLNNLGCALERQGMWEEALAAFAQAVDLALGEPQPIRNRCIAQAACGQLSAMCEDAHQAMMVSDDAQRVLLELRERLLDAGWIPALQRLEEWAVAEGWSTPAECLYTEETAEAIEAT